MSVQLTDEQEAALQPHARDFVAYLSTEESKKDQSERLERVRYFQEELPERLDSLSEVDVSYLLGKLWASSMWGNKQWFAQKVIEDNGLDPLRDELARLLDTSVPPGPRYERGLSNISRLGPASITEILSYSDPANCGIWNGKARSSIRELGLGTIVSPEKYRLTGEEYETFNDLLRAIQRELEAAGARDLDLLMVDYFLYRIPGSSPAATVKAATGTFDHDEVRDIIQQVGAMLGFDAEVEQRIARGAKVDVVWRARIGNLGIVKYVFEVHKSGSIDSLLLNLQKARADASVQKVIAVSDERELQRIEGETEGLQEEFRRSLSLWPVSEVQAVAEQLQLAVESINRLGLVPGVERGV
jgi:hypothetical protein